MLSITLKNQPEVALLRAEVRAMAMVPRVLARLNSMLIGAFVATVPKAGHWNSPPWMIENPAGGVPTIER